MVCGDFNEKVLTIRDHLLDEEHPLAIIVKKFDLVYFAFFQKKFLLNNAKPNKNSDALMKEAI